MFFTSNHWHYQIGLEHAKTNKMTYKLNETKWLMSPGNTQISLGIHPVWSESSLCPLYVAKDPNLLQADIKDSDQTRHILSVLSCSALDKPLAFSCSTNSPQLEIRTGCDGRLFLSVSRYSMPLTISCPLITCPNTTCLLKISGLKCSKLRTYVEIRTHILGYYHPNFMIWAKNRSNYFFIQFFVVNDFYFMNCMVFNRFMTNITNQSHT